MDPELRKESHYSVIIEIIYTHYCEKSSTAVWATSVFKKWP
jgi:hypothetical protein